VTTSSVSDELLSTNI